MGYNQNHPKTRDENLVYIQQYCNRVVHTSVGNSPIWDFFWIFSTSTFGYFKWAERRSEGRSYKICFQGWKIYREDQEDPSTGTRHYRSCRRSIRLGMINTEQKIHSRWEREYGYSWTRRGSKGLVRKSSLWGMIPLRYCKRWVIKPIDSVYHHICTFTLLWM